MLGLGDGVRVVGKEGAFGGGGVTWSYGMDG